MLTFLYKTWFLWWGLAIMLVLRWHHIMVVGSHLKGADPVADQRIKGEQEETWAAEDTVSAAIH